LQPFIILKPQPID